jgi:DNA-directed RNA polymerase specialized sigma24 family protein
MTPRARSTKDWTLQPEAFAGLLRTLDPDRERAGEQYERLRQKLLSLFRWRGCANPEDLVDETFDRVARRLSDGETLRVANPALYFHGVALNVLREHWRDPAGTNQPLSPDTTTSSAILDPEVAHDTAVESARHERRLECLATCLDGLSPESRHLLVTYHQGEHRARIEARRMLAETLGIPMNALRIRVFRVRAGLARCMDRCVNRKSTTASRTTT